MQKLVVHCIVALCMVVLGIIVHTMISGDTTTNAVTTFRLFTMNLCLPQSWPSIDTVAGNPTSPNAIRFSDLWNVQWPAQASSCAALTNLSTDLTCLAARQTVQASILTITNCANKRSSQACTLIQRIVSGLAFPTVNIVTVGGVNVSYPYTAGRRLDGQDAKEYMRRTIANVPLLLHNSYKSSIQDGFSFSAPSLYLLIVIFMALNVGAELLVELRVDDWTMPILRPLTAINALPVLVVFPVYFAIYPGTLNLMLIIFFPTLLVVGWYYQMLPQLRLRPFVRPGTFCVVYGALTILAMGYNGVRRYEFVVVELLKAMGVGLTYMGLCWYFLGLWEKKQRNDLLAPLYSSREAHTSVLLCVFIMAAVPFFTWLAPYDYTFASPILLAHPVLFSVLSLFSLLALNSSVTHHGPANGTRHEDLVSFLCGLLLAFTLTVCSRGAMEFITIYLAEIRAPALPMGPSYIQYTYNLATQLGSVGLPVV